MLRPEEVEFFCRVGRGTPMGETFRRYWTPACPSADLPYPDCPPVQVTLLGEHLVAFRDTTGKVGLLDEYCNHRGSSLVIGRSEDCGLRCLYHGWKFGVDGTIQETPNMPAESKFKDLNRLRSYPVREGGGLIWTYMGPTEEEPPFPHFSWFDVDPKFVEVAETVVDCNYLQVQEGTIDSSHIGILHGGMRVRASSPETRVAEASGVVRFGGWNGERPLDGSPVDNSPTADMSPTFEVENTDFGFQYAAIRSSIYGPSRQYIRVTAFAFPYLALIPPTGLYTLTIPMDDVTTAFIGVVTTANDQDGVFRAQRGQKSTAEEPGRAGRRFVMPPQDRKAMEEGRSFSGWDAVTVQDAAVQTAMGVIPDHHDEHLVAPADAGIARYRHLLRDDAARVMSGQPARFARPQVPTERIEAGSGIVPDGTAWRALVPGNGPVPAEESVPAENTASV
jgi:phthalate 4,5-dioxygenase